MGLSACLAVSVVGGLHGPSQMIQLERVFFSGSLQPNFHSFARAQDHLVSFPTLHLGAELWTAAGLLPWAPSCPTLLCSEMSENHKAGVVKLAVAILETGGGNEDGGCCMA